MRPTSSAPEPPARLYHYTQHGTRPHVYLPHSPPTSDRSLLRPRICPYSRVRPPCPRRAATLPISAQRARPQLNITGYVINADLDPAATKLTATADVTFTALDDLTSATFELNNGLNITKLTDATGTVLNSERLTTASTVHITLPTPIAKNTTTTFHFEYSGVLTGSDTSPVEGIKLAALADPISILLYAGRWFPMTGLFTDRFTADMHIRVPKDYTAVGSGASTKKTLPDGRTEFSFTWSKSGFPGTIVAGKFLPAHQRRPQ